MALADDLAPPPKKGPSIVVQAGVLVALTLLALGGGWFAGTYLRGEAPAAGAAPAPEAAPPAAPAAGGHGEAAGGHGEAAGGHGDAKGGHGEAKGEHGEAANAAPANPLLVPLEPMTTNLSAPSTVWIRIELSLLLTQPEPQDVIESIHQDLFAYIKTLKLHQIEGASGYQHLKTDLEERARIRSDGKVDQVLIRTLLFE